MSTRVIPVLNIDETSEGNTTQGEARKMSKQHESSAISPTDTEVASLPLAQLRAAGLYCLPWRDNGGTYIRMPLADGSELTWSGTATDQDDERGDDVSTHHLVRHHHSWQASLELPGGNASVEIYDSYERNLPYEEDTAALISTLITYATEHGGSAPEYNN